MKDIIEIGIETIKKEKAATGSVDGRNIKLQLMCNNLKEWYMRLWIDDRSIGDTPLDSYDKWSGEFGRLCKKHGLVEE